MSNAGTREVKKLLIDFAHLSNQQKGHFLDTLNHLMFVSPQRRQQILREWEQATTTRQRRTLVPLDATSPGR